MSNQINYSARRMSGLTVPGSEGKKKRQEERGEVRLLWRSQGELSLDIWGKIPGSVFQGSTRGWAGGGPCPAAAGRTVPSPECEALDRALGVSAKRRPDWRAAGPALAGAAGASSLQFRCRQNRFEQRLEFIPAPAPSGHSGSPAGGGSWWVPASPCQEAPAASGRWQLSLNRLAGPGSRAGRWFCGEAEGAGSSPFTALLRTCLLWVL